MDEFTLIVDHDISHVHEEWADVIDLTEIYVTAARDECRRQGMTWGGVEYMPRTGCAWLYRIDGRFEQGHRQGDAVIEHASCAVSDAIPDEYIEE